MKNNLEELTSNLLYMDLKLEPKCRDTLKKKHLCEKGHLFTATLEGL